jgi:hypothetical protein
VDERTVEWLRVLARALVWGAGVVLALSVIGMIQIATTETEVPFFTPVERESRAIAVVGALGGGITAAGILAGLGAILRVLLEARDRSE